DGADFIASITGKNGIDGVSPEIGSNGNWFIGSKDTGIAAQGPQGKSALEVWQSLPGNNGKDGAAFIEAITGASGNDGADGKSAYDIAVDGGFKGSESDWLLSLVGARGADGKSALEIWQELPGNDGKDGADFIASITGKNGIDGVSPEIGSNGNWFIGSKDTGIAAQGP
ncbi:hypothetical protein JKG61_22825, partial [Sphingobacterium sp. C459-1T]|nr:hypothetical protein [Sphingobacterium faecale]